MKNLITALLSLTAAAATAAPVEGWLHMRGPLQTGVSLEKQLPDKILTEDALWTADLPGRSTPTVANGRIFVVGHLGEGANLQEGVFCFDADTGKKLWEHKFNDFLSDIIYTRYSASSPTIDPGDRQPVLSGHAGALRVVHAGRRDALATFFDGGAGSDDVPERPHRHAGRRSRPGDHSRHHGELGRARPAVGSLLRVRQTHRRSSSGRPSLEGGPRTVASPRRRLAGSTASEFFTRPPATAAWSAPTPAPAKRFGRCRSSRPASTPRSSFTTTTSPPRFTGRRTSRVRWSA